MRTMDEIRSEKMRSDDRILVLKAIEGKKIKDVTGMIDPRLFQGGNKLHCVKDPQLSMWSFKYEMGILPEPLRQKFTKFDLAYNFAKNYFLNRGLDIVEVED